MNKDIVMTAEQYDLIDGRRAYRSDIKKDIQKFSQALNDLGELTGERLRVLSRILEELE